MDSVIRVMKTMTKENLDDNDNMSVLFRFVEKYVVKLYGKRAIGTWVKKNKGASFLDMLTMSDVAYSLSVLENNCRVWDQEVEIEDLSDTEQSKYKPQVRKMLQPDEREKYTRVKPKFTNMNLRNRTYMNSGWSEQGIKFYNNIWGKWKGIAQDRESWEKLQVGWELHAEESDFGVYWKVRNVRASSVGEVADDDDGSPGNYFSLPGDDEFEDDRYKSEELVRDDGNDDTEVSTEVGNEIGGLSTASLSEKSIEGSGCTSSKDDDDAITGYDSSSDDTEEDEGRDIGSKKEEKAYHKERSRLRRIRKRARVSY